MPDYDDYPEKGDLVVVTVYRIAKYGAYAHLDEYDNKEAHIHTSELSTTWVKNIRDHAREGQKLVCKVLRVYQRRNQIDLSLRRVTGREKKEKMLQWKLDKKAEMLLNTASEKGQLTKEELDNIKDKILTKYASIHEALEESVLEGSKIFERMEIPSKIGEILTEIAVSKIKIDKARLRAIVELTSLKPNGIEDIKNSLLQGKKVKKLQRDKIEIYGLGAPRYMIQVTSDDYSHVEEILEKATQSILVSIRSLEGEGKIIK